MLIFYPKYQLTKATQYTVIVLNKCDLMSEDQKGEVKHLIELMNPLAKVFESTYSKVPLNMVLGTGLFSMSEAEKHEGWLKEERIGEHTPETIEYGISSFTYRARRPFWPHKLQVTIEAMLEKTYPFDKSLILRAKGFMWLASFSQIQGDFSLAGNHFSIVPGNPWWAEIDKEHWPKGLEEALTPLWREPHGDRQQEIVIIGQRLDKESITKALDDCLVEDEALSNDKEVLKQMCADLGDPYLDDWNLAIEDMLNDGDHGHDHSHDHSH